MAYTIESGSESEKENTMDDSIEDKVDSETIKAAQKKRNQGLQKLSRRDIPKKNKFNQSS